MKDDKFVFRSIYGPFFKEFIAKKQALGVFTLRTEWILFEFDKFFLSIEAKDLGITKEQVEQWRATRINDTPNTIYAKYGILAQFSKFMCKIGYKSYIPRMPVYPHKSFSPHIFSRKELDGIFRVCDNMQLYDRHMSAILFIIPAIVRLLYGTGIRISEALSLKNADVNFTNRSILVRTGKNRQQRLVPLSCSLYEVLKQYQHYRNLLPLPNTGDEDGFFFISPTGKQCRSGSVYQWFRRILAAVNIPHLGNHKGPRVHDLRHTFAVHSLIKMSKAGLDLYYSLPVLSVFLGHQSLGATEYYLRLTSELYPDILEKQKGVSAYVFPKSYNPAGNGNN